MLLMRGLKCAPEINLKGGDGSAVYNPSVDLRRGVVETVEGDSDIATGGLLCFAG
jgi:hypothetical protein